MSDLDYKDSDDLHLYDSVIKKLVVDHTTKSLSFKLLKVVGRIDREGGFTYKVKHGVLKFQGVIYANVPYGMAFDEWSEFYRSAIVENSSLINKLPDRAKNDKRFTHVYLGIDGSDYYEVNIVCIAHSMELEPEEYVLHDDFGWLYED
ncbi:hypothetical protein JZ785_00640 [Alicyclobacillus curvatus]|nr:hypothetical protein JZ785_00640 [Alicyclobacillus curvatus]